MPQVARVALPALLGTWGIVRTLTFLGAKRRVAPPFPRYQLVTALRDSQEITLEALLPSPSG